MTPTPLTIGYLTAAVRRTDPGLSRAEAREIALAVTQNNTPREVAWLFGVKEREG